MYHICSSGKKTPPPLFMKFVRADIVQIIFYIYSLSVQIYINVRAYHGFLLMYPRCVRIVYSGRYSQNTLGGAPERRVGEGNNK